LSQPLFFVLSTAGSATKDGDEDISFADAASYPLVVTRCNQPFREQLESLAKKHSVELDVRYESNSVLMMTSYVESGLACSILPWSAIAEKVALGKVRAKKIIYPSIQQSYLAAWPKSRPLNRPSVAVRDILVSIPDKLLLNGPSE